MDGMEERAIGENSGDAVEERVSLYGIFDVAAEEDGSGGADDAKLRALGRAELRSSETNEE